MILRICALLQLIAVSHCQQTLANDYESRKTQLMIKERIIHINGVDNNLQFAWQVQKILLETIPEYESEAMTSPDRCQYDKYQSHHQFVEKDNKEGGFEKAKSIIDSFQTFFKDQHDLMIKDYNMRQETSRIATKTKMRKWVEESLIENLQTLFDFYLKKYDQTEAKQLRYVTQKVYKDSNHAIETRQQYPSKSQLDTLSDIDAAQIRLRRVTWSTDDMNDNIKSISFSFDPFQDDQKGEFNHYDFPKDTRIVQVDAWTNQDGMFYGLDFLDHKGNVHKIGKHGSDGKRHTFKVDVSEQLVALEVGFSSENQHLISIWFITSKRQLARVGLSLYD